MRESKSMMDSKEFNRMNIESSNEKVSNLRTIDGELRKYKLIAYGSMIFAFILLLVFSLALSTTHEEERFRENALLTTKKWMKNLSLEIQKNQNQHIKPCTDFYQYACGKWLKEMKIPSDKPMYAKSFSSILDKNEESLNETLNENWPVLSPFYQSCMNTTLLDDKGLKPIEHILIQVDQMKNSTNMTEMIQLAGNLSMFGVDFLTSAYVAPDEKNALKRILYVSQPSLPLPDRSYYLNQTKLEKYLPAYKNWILFVFKQKNQWFQNHSQDLGFIKIDTNLTQIVEDILQFEIQMAKFLIPIEQLRNPLTTYHPMTIETSNTFAPTLIEQFLKSAKVPFTYANGTNRIFSVSTPSYFKNMENYLMNSSNPILMKQRFQYYLTYRILHTFSSSLTTEFNTASFEFFGKILQGRKKQAQRWKTCVSYTQKYLGELSARYYVLKNFQGKSLQKAQKMVHIIENRMKYHLKTIEWMDENTRTKALKKLNTIQNLIGHPTKYKNYPMTLKKEKYLQNKLILLEYQHNQAIQKLDQPVDRSEWMMDASDVNAYYDPSNNQMVFPAGILQPPFFHTLYPLAMNYGGIGSVIGHELTHGFDDQGRLYDENGNMNLWWTNKTSEEFQKRSNCLINQYSNFQVHSHQNGRLIGNINGNLTLGENIADNGGIKLAYQAMQYHIHNQTKEEIEEQFLTFSPFTKEQLFFISYAQSWCAKETEQLAESTLLTDVHSPSKWRVNGVLMNFKEFSKAFKCRKGSPMNPFQKCSLW